MHKAQIHQNPLEIHAETPQNPLESLQNQCKTMCKSLQVHHGLDSPGRPLQLPPGVARPPRSLAALPRPPGPWRQRRLGHGLRRRRPTAVRGRGPPRQASGATRPSPWPRGRWRRSGSVQGATTSRGSWTGSWPASRCCWSAGGRRPGAGR